jgi:hypothetical protein
VLTKLPHHLIISRHGIYYLRITSGGKEQRKSLKTRDPKIARAASHWFSATMMSMKKQDQKIRFATIEEILEEEKFQAGVKNHEIQQKAYARIQALEDKAKEDAYVELFIATQYAHLKLPQEVHALQPQVQQVAYAQNLPADPLTVDEAVNRYLAERAGQITFKSHQAYSTHLKRLVAETTLHILEHREHPLWSNVNTDSGAS